MCVVRFYRHPVTVLLLVLLQTLSDIQVALKVLSEGNKEESPIDRHYHGLNCTLTPVDHEEEIFGMVEKYVRQTHAKTHSQYNLEVQEVFQVERLSEKRSFKDVGNRYSSWGHTLLRKKNGWPMRLQLQPCKPGHRMFFLYPSR